MPATQPYFIVPCYHSGPTSDTISWQAFTSGRTLSQLSNTLWRLLVQFALGLYYVHWLPYSTHFTVKDYHQRIASRYLVTFQFNSPAVAAPGPTFPFTLSPLATRARPE